MINLLPASQKKELKQEDSLKIASIFGLVALSYLLSLGLLLFLVKSFLDADLNVQEVRYEEKKEKLASLKNLKEESSFADSSFQKLKNFYENQINYAEIFNKLYPALPANILLSSIAFLSEDEDSIAISLRGVAETREGLNIFKHNLEENKNYFSDINFPPESWIKKTDINFSITFNIILKEGI